jgi:DNA-directed RNA polymerase specialized sigma24 family protein
MDSPQMIPDDCLISAFGLLEREEALLFLVQRIVHLPPVPRRVLAMYYHESLSLSEIALYFGLTEGQIDKIRIETVDLLRKYLLRLWAKTLPLGNRGNRIEKADLPGTRFDELAQQSAL